jgi:hypothetical protein
MDINAASGGLRGIVRSALRALAAALLVVHGLSHAALAYRGFDLVRDVGPRVLFIAACAIAVVGFVIAGLSLARGRPLERWVRAWGIAALLGSVVAFAMARSPSPELWPGLLLDSVIAVALLASSRSANRTAERSRSVLRRVSTITTCARRLEDASAK